MRHVASAGGVSSVQAARRFGAEEATSDVERILADRALDAVVIATRHDSHARLVIDALQADKAVFVEKPLCLTEAELDEIEDLCRQKAAAGSMPLLTVGFNRRFAPQVRKIKNLIGGSVAKSFTVTVNAGTLPPDHWLRDKARGGGRIVGEACHFVDLLRYLAGAPIAAYHKMALQDGGDDTASLQLAFADGSIGTIHYFANGSRSVPKERLEVFCGGRVLQLDNFRKLRGFGWPGFRRMNLWRQDKGHRACAASFLDALSQGGAPPIPLDEVFEVSRVSIALARA